MVKKYYFQLQNGSLNAIQVDDVEALKAKIAKEFGGDKEEAIKTIEKNIQDGKETLSELEKEAKGQEGKERLETECKIANWRLGVCKGEEELKRVKEMEKPDLVFFELTQIEL